MDCEMGRACAVGCGMGCVLSVVGWVMCCSLWDGVCAVGCEKGRVLRVVGWSVCRDVTPSLSYLPKLAGKRGGGFGEKVGEKKY